MSHQQRPGEQPETCRREQEEGEGPPHRGECRARLDRDGRRPTHVLERRALPTGVLEGSPRDQCGSGASSAYPADHGLSCSTRAPTAKTRPSS
ncbi:hypothetical protein [Ornithinimicrobium kibberense]|uniref:hypothetical protein n=1 Tax=Ornithinimicrobium kibberense TaxID=282060 RepID=UPI00361A47CA